MAKRGGMTAARVEEFEMLWGHLSSLYSDVESLAKRKQDGIMSKTRVATVNVVLKEVLAFLEGQPSSKFLEFLDDESLPQNADSLIFLGQYMAAMKSFARANSRDDDYSPLRKWNGVDLAVDLWERRNQR
jgi:hypothetical protein